MRQKRDKTDHGPEYGHIPRDAEGDPVFLILPGALRAKYDRWMADCRAGWLETGDPWAVSSAHTMTVIYRQVSPDWLDEAIYRLADKRRTKAHAKRAREAAVRLMRYMVVRDAHDVDGLSWDKAYERASDFWASFPVAAAEPDTMKKAYQAVKRDLKAGHNGRYFTPQKQNRAAFTSRRKQKSTGG
jgi:hypothetical protein